MLSKTITEYFERNGKQEVSALEDTIRREIIKYSSRPDYKSGGILYTENNWKYKIPSINAEVEINYREDHQRVESERSEISKAELKVYFTYLENTYKKDIEQIRQIFLKNGMQAKN